MLILTRRVGETVMIGNDITVTVLGVKGNQVRVGVNAPKEVAVHREEIYERIKREEQATGVAVEASNDRLRLLIDLLSLSASLGSGSADATAAVRRIPASLLPPFPSIRLAGSPGPTIALRLWTTSLSARRSRSQFRRSSDVIADINGALAFWLAVALVLNGGCRTSDVARWS